MFKFLNQPQYKDHNGNPISADLVQCIAPYKHVIDGFYNWECGQCKHEHASRSCGWAIAGQVLTCEKCGYFNLLVKTNTVELDTCFGKMIELEEREGDVKRKEEKLSEYIPKSRWLEMVKTLKKVSEFQKQFGIDINNCIQGLDTKD